MLYNFFRFTELDGVILYTILTLVLLKLFPGTGTHTAVQFQPL